ncbi:hypothetical protein GW17_00042824 [Ensete ventricosum]|nr:hypothetical protein GW17_00042824 [Ensete ventricosum]
MTTITYTLTQCGRSLKRFPTHTDRAKEANEKGQKIARRRKGMNSDFGVPRELSELQKKRAEYHPDLPPCLQVSIRPLPLILLPVFFLPLWRGLTTFPFVSCSVAIRKLVCFPYGDHDQGTTVRVEFGDSTTCADPSSVHVISRAFPHTFGQPLAHFLRATAKVPDAQIITEHPPMRFVNMSYSTVCLGKPHNNCVVHSSQFDAYFSTSRFQVNSQLISNVCIDALSAEKLILGEEVALSKLTIFDITKQICDAVQARSEKGGTTLICLEKYHGVVLIPEGLIESIPEMYALLQVKSIVKPGCSQDVLKAALSSMASVTEVLSVMSTPSFGGHHQPL